LAAHKADRAIVVREVLAAAGIEAPSTDRIGAAVLSEDGLPRYVWEPVPAGDASYATTVLLSIAQAKRWRAEYEEARRRLGDPARAGPVDNRSATTPGGRPIASPHRSGAWR
jgi:hypothetical protein